MHVPLVSSRNANPHCFIQLCAKFSTFKCRKTHYILITRVARVQNCMFCYSTSCDTWWNSVLMRIMWSLSVAPVSMQHMVIFFTRGVILSSRRQTLLHMIHLKWMQTLFPALSGYEVSTPTFSFLVVLIVFTLICRYHGYHGNGIRAIAFPSISLNDLSITFWCLHYLKFSFSKL